MSTSSLVGKTLHHFDIETELGRGGMAVVYKALQTNLHRPVALKILPPEMAYDQSYIARFQQEARSAAGLEHNHIVPIYEIGSADGFYYIAMKYIEGETLKDVIDREGKLGLPRVIELLRPIGQALDYAHKRGFVHRDIKPSNVMITPEGWVYLTDFGLARGNTEGTAGLTQAGTIMGTPEYMSPEQAQGITVGPASDLYSLAIMVYEMLAGATPFEGSNPQSILFARVMQAPRPPSMLNSTIPQPIEDVLMKALARTPEARYQSARDLFEALEQAAKRSPQIPTSQAYVGQTIAVPPGGGQNVYPSYPPGQHPGSNPSFPPATGGSQPPYVATPYQPNNVSPAYQPTAGNPASYSPQQGSYQTQQQRPASYPPPINQTKPTGYPVQPGTYPATRVNQPSKPKALWFGLAGLVIVALVIGAFMLRSGDKIGAIVERGNQAFDREGGLADAQKAYEEAVKAAPNSFKAHERLALVYLMRGRPIQAQEAAQKAINLEPNNAIGHALMSMAHSDQFQREEGLAQAEEAVRLDPNSALAYIARATARADVGSELDDEAMLDEALADSDDALRLAQGKDRLIEALALNAKGYVMWTQYQLRSSLGDPGASNLVDDGVDQFNRAIGLQGQLPVLYNNLGYFYAQQGYNAEAANQSGEEKFQKAEEAFTRSAGIDSAYSGASTGLGWMHLYRGKYQEARDSFQEGLNRYDKDSQAMWGRGLASYWLGDVDQALKDYQAAIEQAPEMLNAYIDLGYIYLYGSNDYANAEDSFRRALEQNPRFAEAHAGIGDTLYIQSLYDEAMVAYDDAIAIDSQLGLAYLGKANIYSSQGDLNQALHFYDEALRFNGKLANAYVGKSRVQNALGDLEGAKATLEEGLNIVAPNDKSLLQTELDQL